MATDIETLLVRVEAASGPDRSIDGHLAELAGWEWHGDGTVDEHDTFAGHWVRPGFPGNGTFGKRGSGLCDCDTIRPEEGNDEDCPHYTASLDAAIALVEKVLPGWRKTLEERPDTDPKKWEAEVHNTDVEDDPHVWLTGWGPTPALALIAALLRARITQPEKS